MIQTPLHIEIPSRYCPLPTRVHSDADLLQQRGADWLQGFGLCTDAVQRDRMLGNDCAGFYGRIMPLADTARLQLAIDWCFLGFVFDDVNCDEGAASTLFGPFAELAARSLRVLESPSAEVGGTGNSFIVPAQDISRRARGMGTPTQIRRAIDAHRAWYFGVLWEFGCRSMSNQPSLNDYAYMRQHAAGGMSTICWMEIIDGAEIPEHELSSPAVRAATEIALTTAALDDDLFSYGKEKWIVELNPHTNAANLNIVDILVSENGSAPHEAIAEATDLCNRLTFRFIELRDHLLKRASAPLRDYLDHLSHLLRGNIEWGLRAPRYTNPNGLSPNAVTTTITWTEAPPPDSGPPAIPSIAWWWDID